MQGGFRQFVNDINKQGPSALAMPTYDNFKKDFKASGSNTRKTSTNDNMLSSTKNDGDQKGFKAEK